MPNNVTTLDLRELGCQQRHGLVFLCLAFLKPGESIAILNDHDPEPLRRQLEARFPARVEWSLRRPSPNEFQATIRLKE